MQKLCAHDGKACNLAETQIANVIGLSGNTTILQLSSLLSTLTMRDMMQRESRPPDAMLDAMEGHAQTISRTFTRPVRKHKPLTKGTREHNKSAPPLYKERQAADAMVIVVRTWSTKGPTNREGPPDAVVWQLLYIPEKVDENMS